MEVINWSLLFYMQLFWYFVSISIVSCENDSGDFHGNMRMHSNGNVNGFNSVNDGGSNHSEDLGKTDSSEDVIVINNLHDVKRRYFKRAQDKLKQENIKLAAELKAMGIDEQNLYDNSNYNIKNEYEENEKEKEYGLIGDYDENSQNANEEYGLDSNANSNSDSNVDADSDSDSDLNLESNENDERGFDDTVRDLLKYVDKNENDDDENENDREESNFVTGSSEENTSTEDNVDKRDVDETAEEETDEAKLSNCEGEGCFSMKKEEDEQTGDGSEDNEQKNETDDYGMNGESDDDGYFEGDNSDDENSVNKDSVKENVTSHMKQLKNKFKNFQNNIYTSTSDYFKSLTDIITDAREKTKAAFKNMQKEVISTTVTDSKYTEKLLREVEYDVSVLNDMKRAKTTFVLNDYMIHMRYISIYLFRILKENVFMIQNKIDRINRNFEISEMSLMIKELGIDDKLCDMDEEDISKYVKEIGGHSYFGIQLNEEEKLFIPHLRLFDEERVEKFIGENKKTCLKQCVTVTCPPNSNCYNINGHEECRCKAGFSVANVVGKLECVKNDSADCRVNNGGCDINARCEESNGTIKCECAKGFIGDGIYCSFSQFAIL